MVDVLEAAGLTFSLVSDLSIDFAGSKPSL
jgi:hypothetical protein